MPLFGVQIQNECTKFGASSKIKNTCIYGGVPKGPQVCDLQKGTSSAFHFLLYFDFHELSLP